MPRTACSMCLRVHSLGTTLSTNSQVICARRTRTSFTHRTANRRPSTTPVVWRGALVRVGEKPDYTGLDVIIVRDGKIAALYVFLDSMPS